MGFPDILDNLLPCTLDIDDITDMGLPPVVIVDIYVGNAVSDNKAWYHLFFKNGYGTPNYITVKDINGNDVKGNVRADANSNNIISFTFDYMSDTIGGVAGTDKKVILLVEGDGRVTNKKVEFTIYRTNRLYIPCVPDAEYNI